MASADPISAAWLADICALPIESVRVTHVGTFSSDVYRLHCRGGDVPDTLILKRPRPGKARLGESFALEARVYRELAVRLPIRLPRCYATADDYLVLEDVTLEPISFKAGPTPAHTAAALTALRRLHRCEGPAWVPSFADETFCTALAARFQRGWQRHRLQLAELCPEFTALGERLCSSGAANYRALGARATLLHGDAHLENLPLTVSGELVALDWQGPRLGHPLFDLAYFVVLSYPTNRRRAVEDALLRDYLAAAPDVAARQLYARAVLARASGIVELTAELPGERLQKSAFGWVVARCLLAAADWSRELPGDQPPR